MLFIDILNVLMGDDPQPLFAVTPMLPLVALAVAAIEVVVEEPVHPEGKVQL